MPKGVGIYKIGGLYLDCGIGGSRTRQEKHYTLFTVTADGHSIVATSNGNSWAVDLWDSIDVFLSQSCTTHNSLVDFSDDQIRAEFLRRNLSM